MVECLLSGLVGSVLTVALGLLISLFCRWYSFKCLKGGLCCDCLSALAHIIKVSPVYGQLWEQNSFRIDTAVLRYSKEHLTHGRTDQTLLMMCSHAILQAEALNRLLDTYQDECFRSSGEAASVVMPPSYIVRMNGAVRKSFVLTFEALEQLGKQSCPRQFAKNAKSLALLGKLEEYRKQNIYAQEA